MFWKRVKKEPPRDRITELANRLMKEGRTAEIEAALLRFDPAALEGAELESWHHHCGITAFQRGDRAEAYRRFAEGIRHCPDSGLLLFSMGQEHEFRGEVDRMFECFDRALFPRIFWNFALAEARYAYLWSRYDKGRSYLAPFWPIYFKLKCLDTTFLHLRGLPFFDRVWRCLAAFAQLTGDFGETARILERAAGGRSRRSFAP